MKRKHLAMGKIVTEGIRWHEVYVEVLDARVTITKADSGIYFSISDLCDALGITPRQQHTKIWHDTRFEGQRCYLPVRIGKRRAS